MNVQLIQCTMCGMSASVVNSSR